MKYTSIIRRICFILVAVTFLYACSKEPRFDGLQCTQNCIVLSGNLVDTPFNNRISDVDIKIYYQQPGPPSIFIQPTYIGKTKTNKDGNYSFRFDGEKYMNGGYFIFYVHKPGYFHHVSKNADFEQIGSINTEDIRLDQPTNDTTKLYKRTSLFLKIKTTKEKLDFKGFDITYQVGKYPWGFNIIFDKKIDTLIELNMPVGIPAHIGWEGRSYLEPPVVKKQDSVFSKSGENVSYEIML